MDILTIAIRNNQTILGKFKKKKNTFKIEDITPHKSLLPLLTASNADLLGDQVKYMIDGMEANDAQIYVTLSSSICRQDCWESDAKVVDKVKLASWIETILQNEIKEEYAIGLPILQRFDKKMYVSGAGTKKVYIDRLYRAFKNAEADLVAIEAESVAYVRAISRWNINYIFVDVDENTTNITAYAAKVGMYTTTIPFGITLLNNDSLGIDVLRNEIELAIATWNFPVEAPKQIFVAGTNVSEEIIRQIRLKNDNDNIHAINLPKLSHSEAFRRELLVLPIGSVYRNLYEKGRPSNADTNYEFSTSRSRGGKSISSYQTKTKQGFDFSRLRAYFRRNR